MKVPKIFYAPSKIIYGTARMDDEILYLKFAFPAAEIINPEKQKDKNAQYFLKQVSDCNQVVLSEYEGFIGKGNFSVLTKALSSDKKVFVLRRRKNNYNLIPISGVLIVKPNDWKKEYAKLILNY